MFKPVEKIWNANFHQHLQQVARAAPFKLQLLCWSSKGTDPLTKAPFIPTVNKHSLNVLMKRCFAEPEGRPPHTPTHPPSLSFHCIFSSEIRQSHNSTALIYHIICFLPPPATLSKQMQSSTHHSKIAKYHRTIDWLKVEETLKITQ